MVTSHHWLSSQQSYGSIRSSQSIVSTLWWSLQQCLPLTVLPLQHNVFCCMDYETTAKLSHGAHCRCSIPKYVFLEVFFILAFKHFHEDRMCQPISSTSPQTKWWILQPLSSSMLQRCRLVIQPFPLKWPILNALFPSKLCAVALCCRWLSTKYLCEMLLQVIFW